MNNSQSSIRDFETYLRILTGLTEDDIQLILEQYNSKFVTYETSPGIYTYKDIFEVLSRGFEKEIEIRGGIQPNTKDDNPIQLLSNRIKIP